jgi:hypothetical protein
VRGGLEYLGEGGWSTWERGVRVPGRGGLEYLRIFERILQRLEVDSRGHLNLCASPTTCAQYTVSKATELCPRKIHTNKKNKHSNNKNIIFIFDSAQQKRRC